MDSNSQIKLSIVIAYFSIFVNIITGLLYTPWMISSLGRENFGLYTLASSVIAFFMFDFGLSSAITRFMSKYIAEGQEEKANNCLGLVYRLYFVIDIFFFVVLLSVFLFIPDIYQKLTPDEIEKFRVVYVIAAIYSVIAFPFIPLNGILSANEKFVPLQIAELSQKIIMVSLMSICLFLGMGLYALVLVNAFAGLITILLKICAIRRYTESVANLKYRNRVELRELLSFSGWSTVISLSQRFVLTIAPTFLGILSGSAAIAIFGISMTIEGYAYTFSSVIGSPFLPKVTKITIGNPEGLMPLMIKVGRIQYVAVAAIFIGYVCLGYQFILLWVGESFKSSYLCATILILPSFFSTPETIADQAIFAKNLVKYQAYSYIITSVLNLLLMYIFVKNWGALGAAVSICISYLIRWLCLNIIYYRKLNIDIAFFYKETLLKLSPAFVGIVAFSYAFNQVLLGHSWMLFIVKVSLFAIVYASLIYCVMNSYEREMVLKPLRRFLNRKNSFKYE